MRLDSMRNIFADYRIMLSRTASNILFISSWEPAVQKDYFW